MGLWGKSTSAESRPKFLGGDGAQGAGGAKEDAFATTAGWALRPGTAASGNDNTSADPEVLVAIGDLSATLGAANCLSADFVAGEYARGESFDIVLTFDEAITVTSAAFTADNVISNKVHFTILNYGPTDMVNDGAMQMQYFSGSGTNKLTFRGTIPSTAVAGGFLGDPDFALTTDGSSAMVDGNGTTVTEGDLSGSGAIGGPDGSTAVFGNAIKKTGSDDLTEETKAGTSSGSAQILKGVTTAVS